MNKAIFRYWVDGLIIAIEDIGHQCLSVTVDAERVLQAIDDAIGPLVGKHVIYADQEGIWDGLTYSKGKLLIYHIGAVSYSEAKEKLCLLPQAKQERYRLNEAPPTRQSSYDWFDV